MCVVCVCVCAVHEKASLEKTSFLSILADLVLVGFMVVFSPITTTVKSAGGFFQVIKENAISNKLFIGLGVLSTAMACQQFAFIVSNSLQDHTPTRWATVTSRSICVGCLLCLLLGICGYLGFLEDTHGNILNNFDADSIVVNAGRGLLAITMLLTYPVEGMYFFEVSFFGTFFIHLIGFLLVVRGDDNPAFVARHVLVELLFDGDMDGDDCETFVGKYFGRRQRVTLSIYIATIVPACILDDLGPVLSLTGALGASLLSYMGSGVVYLGLNGDDFLLYCLAMLTKGSHLHEQLPTKEDQQSGDNANVPNGKDQLADEVDKSNEIDSDILTQCQQMLKNHQGQVDSLPRQPINLLATAEIELTKKVIGASQSTRNDEMNIANRDVVLLSSHDALKTPDHALVPTDDPLARIQKPLWWYLLLFPIWTAIASSGAKGTRQFMDDHTRGGLPPLVVGEPLVLDVGDPEEDGMNGNPPRAPSVASDNASTRSVADSRLDPDLVIGPCVRDYYMSMFLIIFGFMAAVVGVGSNIYVEVDKFLINKNNLPT